MKKNAMAEVNNYLWRREERSRDTRFTEQYFLDHQNRTFGTEVFRKIMGIEDLPFLTLFDPF